MGGKPRDLKVSRVTYLEGIPVFLFKEEKEN
jgi:hypothetical protein